MSDIKPEKRRTIVSPWKNVAEFEKVHNWIFGEATDELQQRRALSHLRIWSLRRSTLCPAAVLATKTLLEVKLRDTIEGHGEQLTLVELQTLYASAFTRFFNFMSSTMQMHNLRTMYETAQQLGLPWFVVDLRHICAHGQVLPPIELLRTSVANCLSWLNDYYWRTQLSIMCDVDATRIRRKDKTEFDENVSNLFEIYDAALECYCKGAHNMKTGKRFVHGKRLTRLKEYYAKHELGLLRKVFDCVENDLVSLVKREYSIKDLSEIYIEALLRMKFFFTVADTHSSGENLESLINVTRSFFRMLAVSGFIEDLFYSLMEMAENTFISDARRKSAGFWALQIVAGFVAFRKCKRRYKAEIDMNLDTTNFDFSTLNMDNLSKKMRRHLIYAGVDVKNTLIFGDTIHRPSVWVFERSYLEKRLNSINEYTAPALKEMLMLVDPALTSSEEKSMYDLIDILFKDETSVVSKTKKSKTHEENSEVIHTASELLKLLEKNSTNKMEIDVDGLLKTENNEFGIWKMATDDDVNNWSLCPLGRLPWD